MWNTKTPTAILTIIILLSSIDSICQSTTLEELDKTIISLSQKVNILQSEISKQKVEIKNLNSQLSITNKTIESLKEKMNENSKEITTTKEDLGLKIKENSDISKDKISQISNSLSKNSVYGIVGVVLAILVSGLLYWILSVRQKANKTEVITQLSNTKLSIEESLVKEFAKQTQQIDTQLTAIGQQSSILQANPNTEPDHSLALKVASEINLIERNITLMDSKTKGLKQLYASVGKLKDNLSANGYEMPELLGKQFHQGMKVIVANSIPDENLEKGAEVISKILIPQVNFNDKMIQTAQIEVSIGY